MYRFDDLDTFENWTRITNTEVQLHDTVYDKRGNPLVVRGFGPYFLWVSTPENQYKDKQFRLAEFYEAPPEMQS